MITIMPPMAPSTAPTMTPEEDEFWLGEGVVGDSGHTGTLETLEVVADAALLPRTTDLGIRAGCTTLR